MTTTVTPPSRDPGETQHLTHRRRLLVLGICSMSLLIVGLDTTIVNVALPAIHHSLNASITGLQWTIDAYTLVLASLLMLAGSSVDRSPAPGSTPRRGTTSASPAAWRR